ncbi:MAG: nicotinate (nicotinamide) nucleotide adenylyltransferase [Lentisphaeria bacterium]|nr:nicotinate (nicotinamide) nucleotide adenylyltransferase [Lentisphaeria bacterium]
MTLKAFFGGSFDPPHPGHLGVARAAIASGKCDEVVWFPGFLPPHKQNTGRAPFIHRLAMVQLLIAGEKNMSASDFENQLQLSPSYTLTILRKLREMTGENYLLLIGADSLMNLHTWYHAGELVDEFGIITYPRNNCPVSWEYLCRFWDKKNAGKLFDSQIPGTFFEISSSEVRNSMEKNSSMGNIISRTGLTAEVAGYIEEHRLYQNKKG